MDRERLEEREQTLPTERAAYLAKWLRILFFWSLFSVIVIGALQTDRVQILIQFQLFIRNPQLITVCLELAGPVGAIFLFVKLGRMSSYYRCVIFCLIASVAVNLTLLDKGRNSPTWWAMSLLGLMVAVVKTYQQYHGHAEMLDEIHHGLADKWRRLWKWCVRLLLGILAGGLTALSHPNLGGILLLVSFIGLAVLGILELVYLWRTVSAFRNYAPEELFVLPETTDM